MLVMNPFEGQQEFIHLYAPIVRGHLLNVPHHVSIISDDQNRFIIVYVRVVNQVSFYHLYDFAVGVWVVRESVLAGNELLGIIGFMVADDENHLLYTFFYHPLVVVNQNPVYSITQIWDHDVGGPRFSQVFFLWVTLELSVAM
ncbi:hypothetical protein CTI12_AA019380 [Artemisia annua]|uniref:Uncharacterized protein n=1 Tax=Artemisia annua TaxID=35608 RepID=A0A2U1QKA6_ARTAN|nr:hypothetical protein CTI12_AA019380 [Artemisia annua]